MKNIHQQLLTRPTFVEVDNDAIRHNFSEVQKLVNNKKIMCIVKGNAYGHGIVPMGLLFQSLGADYLGVAIPEEGVELRTAGVTVPILVLSAISDRQIPVCIDYDLTITAPSDEKLMMIDKTAQESGKQAKVHIKIDTGMGRIGVNWQRVQKFFPVMQQCTHTLFEGLYSHFACSDNDSDFNTEQKKRMQHAVDEFTHAGFHFDIIHFSNSGGIIFHSDAHYSMVRAGMILYGLFEGRDLPAGVHLKPAMTWKTEVVYFKYIEKSTSIGYGQNFIANTGTRIVTLPVGYADGYQRAMGARGKVIIHDKQYPIAGRICMDQMMVDIGPQGEAYKGDEVILVGTSSSCSISFFDIANWSDTSIYELLSQISHRVPRIYINE